jgi:hypothetical protein
MVRTRHFADRQTRSGGVAGRRRGSLVAAKRARRIARQFTLAARSAAVPITAGNPGRQYSL